MVRSVRIRKLPINDRDGIHYYQFHFIKTKTCIIVLGFLKCGRCGGIEIRAPASQRSRAAAERQCREINFLPVSHDMRTPLNGIIGLLEIDKKHEMNGFLKSNEKVYSFQPRNICSLHQ